MGMWISSTRVQIVRFRHLIVTAIGASVLLLGSGGLLAQDEDTPVPAEEQEEADNYPAAEREFGNPTEVEQDLNNSLPKPDSLVPQLKPQRWANFKQQLYKKHGLKLGFSYQGIYQYASESLTEQDTAAGGSCSS